MKSKGLLVLLLAMFFSVMFFSVMFFSVMFFSVIITPVFAATTQQQSLAFATEQMPAWLVEAGAVPVSDVALENVQGELDPVSAWLICSFLLTTPGVMIWANDQVINFNYNYAVGEWRAQHGVSNLDLAKMYFQRVQNMLRYTRITWSVLYGIFR